MKSSQSVSTPPFLHHPPLTSDAAGTQISSLILPLLSPEKKKKKKNPALTQPAGLLLACIRSSIYALGHESRKRKKKKIAKTKQRNNDDGIVNVGTASKRIKDDRLHSFNGLFSWYLPLQSSISAALEGQQRCWHTSTKLSSRGWKLCGCVFLLAPFTLSKKPSIVHWDPGL